MRLPSAAGLARVCLPGAATATAAANRTNREAPGRLGRLGWFATSRGLPLVVAKWPNGGGGATAKTATIKRRPNSRKGGHQSAGAPRSLARERSQLTQAASMALEGALVVVVWRKHKLLLFAGAERAAGWR